VTSCAQTERERQPNITMRGLPPDNDTILRLAKALGIHPPELLLVEAHRVTPQLKDVVTVMLSATKPPTKAEYEQVVKKIQGFLTHKKAKNTHK